LSPKHYLVFKLFSNFFLQSILTRNSIRTFKVPEAEYNINRPNRKLLKLSKNRTESQIITKIQQQNEEMEQMYPFIDYDKSN